MFNGHLKRFTAVLLACVVVGGVLCPTYVYAAIPGIPDDAKVSGTSVTVGTQYVAREANRAYAFPGCSDTDLTPIIEISCGSVKEVMPAYSTLRLGKSTNPDHINDYNPTNRTDTIGTGVKSALEDCDANNAKSVLWTGDESDMTEKDIVLHTGTLPGLSSSASGVAAPSFMDLVINTVIDDSSGIATSADLDAKLNAAADSIGASVADLSNLNQRMASALYHYINWYNDVDNGGIFDVGSGVHETNPSILYDSIDTISDVNMNELLTSTLAMGHPESLQQMLRDIGLYTFNMAQFPNAANDIKQCGLAYYPYSVNALEYLGILSVDCFAGGSNSSIKTAATDGNAVVYAEYMAALICLSEYITFYRDNMVAIEQTAGWQNDASCQASLFFIRKFHDAFGGLIPIVEKIYHIENPEANNKSIYDMVKEVEDSILNLSMTDAISLLSDMYVPHQDTESPINQFYTVNSNVGIVSYDRDAVLNDSVVPELVKDKNTLQQQTVKEQSADNTVTGGNSDYQTDNTFLTTQAKIAQDLLNVMRYKKGVEHTEKTYLPDGAWIVQEYVPHMQAFKKTEEGKKAVQGLWDYIHPEDPNDGEVTEVKGTARTLYRYILNYLQVEKSQIYSDEDLDEPGKLFAVFSTPAVIEQLVKIASQESEELEKFISENNLDLGTAFDEIGDTLVDFGVSSAGNSSSYVSVTMNEFIVEGMGYSANYVPMQTNVYSTDLIRSYIGDEADERFYNMYLNYGFMRKALLIDRSATAVMDYYNANGVCTNSTKVCTLRDLIESEDRDIALYVDSNLYNADEAAKQGYDKLQSTFADNRELLKALSAYVSINKGYGWFGEKGSDALERASDTVLITEVAENISNDDKLNLDSFNTAAAEKIKEIYQYDISKFESIDDLLKEVKVRERSQRVSTESTLNTDSLKTGSVTAYDAALQAALNLCLDYKYVNVSNKEDKNTPFLVDVTDAGVKTDDNSDSIVLSSMMINHYLCGKVAYSETSVNEDESTETTNTYTMNLGYSPMMSFAYISCLYRDVRFFSLANVIEHNNPVFLASDDLVTIDEAPQWYKNTLLNYMLIKNIKGNTQIDVSYVTDLDCPVYVDIFGNILTESGIVVVPAACNATLHTSSFNQYNYAAGLYTCYGSNYRVPADLKNAILVIYPFFIADNAAKEFVINGYQVSANGTAIRFDKLDTYDNATRDALTDAYLSFISNNGEVTRLNWMACVKIVNEVMRGAPIEHIDKKKEGLGENTSSNTAGIVAAAKLESLDESLNGDTENSLLRIPDFTRMDNIEYYVALFMKLIMVATAAVIILAIYRDGVSGCLGIKTLWKSASAIALTVAAIVVIPAVFQLTYYSANRSLLADEALSILMVNEEKRQGGVEIGVTKTNTIESNGEFALQLDTVDVPWYKTFSKLLQSGAFVDTVGDTAVVDFESDWTKMPWSERYQRLLASSTFLGLDEIKQEAYESSPVYNHSDVEVYNDGVYVTTDSLFDSVLVDFDFNAVGSSRALRLTADPTSEQTASYYSPYYVFLRALVENVNDYNTWFGTSGKEYTDLSDAQNAADLSATKSLNSYNYSTKLMSGNRKMTVGLTKSYFESPYFMQDDDDVLRLMQIYCGDIDTEKVDAVTESGVDAQTSNELQGLYSEGERVVGNAALQELRNQEALKMRSFIFSDDDRRLFRNSKWFNNDLIVFDDEYYNALETGHEVVSELESNGVDATITDSDLEDRRAAYIEDQLTDFYARVDAMNNFARDFVASNQNMLGKVTDETFLKVMALAMAIKYNQLFGVHYANTLEIYNMDSMDLMRLCIVPKDEAVMASAMSYPRFCLTFGGEAAVYMSAVLSIILWLGSYIKPLCTVIVFISVFMSIFVFRVVLRKPSANLVGYLVTVGLLCATNLLHALILKIGVALPNFGLSTLGCLIFIVVGQVGYLLVLSYVTGVSLRDWSNLGANEYQKEAGVLRSKFKYGKETDRLNGAVPHHEDNWDYYNDLVNQHRSRNASGMSTSVHEQNSSALTTHRYS